LGLVGEKKTEWLSCGVFMHKRMNWKIKKI
jgi:hypothetical protein